jgi:hypothetical protein
LYRQLTAIDSPVFVEATIEGPAAEVMAALRKIGGLRCNLKATVTSKIINSRHRGWYESNDFPIIENGDGDSAMQRLEHLARQRLIEPDVEREVADVMASLITMSRHR